MEVLYVRRSTAGQTESFTRQIEGKTFQKVYTDTCSGAVDFFQRTAVKELIADIEKNKITTIYAHELSRLGRNLRGILETINFFTERKIQLVVKKEGIRLFDEDGRVSPTTMLLINLLGTFSQLEREMTLDRQREGIRIARLNNKFLGRRVGSVETRTAFLNKPKVQQAMELLRENRLKKYEVAAVVGLSANTVTKVARMM